MCFDLRSSPDFSPQLRDQIWEGPEDKAILKGCVSLISQHTGTRINLIPRLLVGGGEKEPCIYCLCVCVCVCVCNYPLVKMCSEIMEGEHVYTAK